MGRITVDAGKMWIADNIIILSIFLKEGMVRKDGQVSTGAKIQVVPIRTD